MDPARFDALARAAGRAGSRRRVLGGLAAVALAPLTAAATPAPAACLAVGKRCSQSSSGAARGKGKKGKKSKHHPPSCGKCCSRFGAPDPNGKSRCACKGEGVGCDNDSQCCGGQCRTGSCTGCPGNTVFCTDGCADLQTNNQHCGSCDNACASGQRCQAGQCVCDATSCPTGCCDATGQCKRGTSPSACGDNGATCQTCETGQRCDGDSCVCDAINCPNGCCDATSATCQAGDTPAVCGAGGGTCRSCVGNNVAPDCVDGACTCKSGVFCSGSVPSCCPNAKDVCHAGTEACCTPTTCAAEGATCGSISDGCGHMLDCGQCATGQLCAGQTCVAGQGTCAAGDDFCSNTSKTCNGRQDCTCRITTEGDTRCGGNAVTGTCGECSSSAQCATMYPNVLGVFCLKGGTGCCNSTAPNGLCAAPCPTL